MRTTKFLKKVVYIYDKYLYNFDGLSVLVISKNCTGLIATDLKF